MCGGVYCIEQKSTYLRSKLEAKFKSPKFKEPFRDYRWRIIVKGINSSSSRRKKIVLIGKKLFFSFNLEETLKQA